MFLKKIEIKNFRLWKDTSIELEQQSTMIVGKNNCGKTSFMDLMQLLVKNKNPKFDDYPLQNRKALYQKIIDYMAARCSYKDLEDEFLLPIVNLHIDYSLERVDDNLGALASFIIDTDSSITNAFIEASYSLTCTKEQFKSFFGGTDLQGDNDEDIIRNILEKNYNSFMKLNFFAVNPQNTNKRRKVEHKEFCALFPIFAIKAERSMDESDFSNETPLKGIVTSIFQPELDKSFDDIKPKIDELHELCDTVNKSTQDKVNVLLKDIVQDSLDFGYPSAEDQQLVAKSQINLEDQIKNSVDLHYHNNTLQETLPSGYNGLGYKNLVKIELELINFAKKIKECIGNSIPLIFIEEPESHMHPQMQQRFIEHIDNYCKKISEQKKIQVVITTHSSHILNSTEFEKVRYVIKKNDSVQVKNLNDFCNQANSNKDFIEKYLTLNKCDLFFADKAILIEGTAERLLIPDMIAKLNKAGKFSGVTIPLESQYYTLIEVGGAYAYKFIPFMEFIEIPALIVTDIDSIGNDRKACLVKDGQKTSNATINRWFSDILHRQSYTFQDIKSLASNNKTNNFIHIEYQVEENGLCGRSLEEALKNANRSIYGLSQTATEDNLEYNPNSDGSKTDFAMNLVFEHPNYNVPRYIENGLVWLNCQKIGR